MCTALQTAELDVLCHLAMCLEAIAFWQTDIVKLRAVEVLSAAMIATYSIVHTNKNWADCHFIWGMMHMTVNAYRCKTHDRLNPRTKLTTRCAALRQ